MGILLSEAVDAATDAEALAAGNGAATLFGSLLYFVVIIGVFWFLLMRPQGKEKKRIAAMLSSLAVGDSVMTTSGFYGTVIAMEDDTVIVEFGNNKNCRIPMEKTAISKVEKPGE